MIVSPREQGALCIPQSQHAAICGQMAAAWGNEQFTIEGPWTEVCLAAACHDDGMDDFDAAPELDAETGLPRDFMRMPLEPWLECWHRGPELAAARGPYVGLLVSMHGTHLLGYRRFDDDPEGRAAADAYLAEQRAFRERLLAELDNDVAYADHAKPMALERNRKLLAVWDAMSLAICVPRLPQEIGGVPVDGGEAVVTMRGAEPDTDPVVTVDPWPFTADRLVVNAEGRRLDRRFESEAEMREALAAAEVRQLRLTFVPARA
jgi:hypothetical protein